MSVTDEMDAPVAEPKPRQVPSAEPQAAAAPPRNGRRKLISLLIFLAVVGIVAGVALWYYLTNLGFESTDDAFIDADIYEIAPKVPGRLIEVTVDANQSVEAGQLLARIDPADYEWDVKQAQAALELARAQQHESEVQVSLIKASTVSAVATAQAEKTSAEAKLEQEKADLAAAQTEYDRASADLERYQQLSDRAVSQQRLDVIRSQAQTAESAVRAAEKRVAAAQAEVAAASARLQAAQADTQRVEAAQAELQRRHAEVDQAQARLEQAKLYLSYTNIIAPAAGRVTRKAIMPGDYVSVGQGLMALVGPDPYVTANFKETQLEHIEPGQPASIHIDAYDVDLQGHVQSIQAGSGAAFSLLPPQNATGNFVKVVQRVPVKIVFDDPQAADYLLGPGMSVVPRVDTR